MQLQNNSVNPISRKVKYPISFQLITIFGLLVALALGIIMMLVTYFVSSDAQRTAEENNHTVNSRSASAVYTTFETTQSNVFLFLDMLHTAGGVDDGLTSLFFARNKEIAAMAIFDENKSARGFVNSAFFKNNSCKESVVSEIISNEQVAIQRAGKGELCTRNATQFFGIPVIAMFCPHEIDGEKQTVMILFSAESLTENFGIGAINQSFMINDEGELLLHSDLDLLKKAGKVFENELVKAVRLNNDENRQMLYTDVDGKDYFGAYTKLSIGNIVVITTVAADIVFEVARTTMIRNIYLSVSVLFLSILLIWFWSKSISRPVRQLATAAGEISNGQFEIKMYRKRSDELAILTESFVNMGHGLAERERLKDTFGRFINKEIAEKAMKGDLKLGGESKNVTIFFSDIRSFTAMSEKMTPHEVVEFLNDYMTRMVGCVNKTSGVVDKYIGDAIMAVWGTPVSSGSPKDDALNCVRAAMMMRAELWLMNKERTTKGLLPVHIGCGINSGEVIAGQIGSSERMEYTVIGDAVNVASRTESLNKPFATDILITANTYELIKEHLIVEEMPSVSVKGKSEPLKMYAVVNIIDATDIKGAGSKGPKVLEQVRTMLGVKAPDLANVDTNSEEKKYEIKG